MNEIEDFISHFHGAEDTFLHGCCYWFARILEQRFIATHACTILYEPIEGHFVARLATRVFWKLDDNGEYVIDEDATRLYDVRGDVTEMYGGKELINVRKLRGTDPSWYRHLMRDCRDFIRPTDEELNYAPVRC